MELSSVGVNLNEVELENREFKAIPNGKYTAILAAMECKTSKSGKQYLNAEFVISEGQYENTKLFEIFMLEGSEKSVSITKQRLKCLATACGMPEAEDTDELIGIQMQITVKTERDEQGNDKNRISWFKELPNAEHKKPATWES